MGDFDQCVKVKDYIRHFAFLDSVDPETKFRNMCAFNLYSSIASQKIPKSKLAESPLLKDQF